MLLEAITHSRKRFSTQKTVTTSYFRLTILNRVGNTSYWLKINKRGEGGVAIRMSRYAFIEKIKIVGGGVYSGLESKMLIKERKIPCKGVCNNDVLSDNEYLQNHTIYGNWCL